MHIYSDNIHAAKIVEKTSGERKCLTVGVKKLQSVLDSIAGSQAVHLLLLLDEGDEGRPLDLHGLTSSIVQGDHKVEKVGLPKICGRLLLKMSSSDTRSPKRMIR